MMRPSVLRSRVDNSSFRNARHMAISGVDYSGAGNISDTNLQETLRIDAYIRSMAQGLGLDGVQAETGGATWQRQEDPLQRMLSSREDISAELGLLFLRITGDHLQTGNHSLPDDAVPGLRDSTFARRIGEMLLDSGVLAPTQRHEYEDMQPNNREEMSLALGDLIRSIDSQHHRGGSTHLATELDNLERDATSMALGRAVVNMITAAQEGPSMVRMMESDGPLKHDDIVRRIGQQF